MTVAIRSISSSGDSSCQTNSSLPASTRRGMWCTSASASDSALIVIQLWFALAYGLAKLKDHLVAVLNLASQINAIVPQTGDLHALPGNPGALPFDHLAGVPNTQAQGVDDRCIPSIAPPQRGTMLARGLEHRIWRARVERC